MSEAEVRATGGEMKLIYVIMLIGALVSPTLGDDNSVSPVVQKLGEVITDLIATRDDAVNVCGEMFRRWHDPTCQAQRLCLDIMRRTYKGAQIPIPKCPSTPELEPSGKP